MPGEPERVEAEFMFSLLDYSTWNLFWGEVWIAQVALNHVDHSVALTIPELGVDTHGLRRLGNYSSWVRFLDTHSRPRTAH